MAEKISLQTAVLHHDYLPPTGFTSFTVPIHHASTVLFNDVQSAQSSRWEDQSAYAYGLHGTPTTFTLEARLATLEGGEHCVLAPSGLAAIAIINLALLRSGEEILIPNNAYGSGQELGAWLHQRLGIKVRLYPPSIGAGIYDMIQPCTKLIWVEAPGSITMEIPDVVAICAAAHQRQVLIAMDNTWSAGLAFRAFEHGVDISVQALTKYQSGGSDVLMGAIITKEEKLHHSLNNTRMRLGMGVGADDAYLVLRSLPTLELRYDAHDNAARQIATWLKTREEIAQVLHPAFSDCCGHEIWKRDFTGAGGLFSAVFTLRYTTSQVHLFVERLKLFKIGFSWGGSHSICMPYPMKTIRDNWEEKGELVRFYIGLECPHDLITDLEQALSELRSP